MMVHRDMISNTNSQNILKNTRTISHLEHDLHFKEINLSFLPTEAGKSFLSLLLLLHDEGAEGKVQQEP